MFAPHAACQPSGSSSRARAPLAQQPRLGSMNSFLMKMEGTKVQCPEASLYGW